MFSEEKTMPILQVPQNECIYAFTTGYDEKTLQSYEYNLFSHMTVYNDKGEWKSYRTNHGKYISFSFIGASCSEYNMNQFATFWSETKQMAFYCYRDWMVYKLSAFVLENDNVHLVDLNTDEVLTTFPLGQSSYTPDLKIMVFAGGMNDPRFFQHIVINSRGGVTFYDIHSISSNIANTKTDNATNARIYDASGVQIEDTKSGLNIIVEGDGTVKKIVSK